MEQNREPRNKPTHLQSINLRQRMQEYTMEKTVSSANSVEESWTVTCKSMKLEQSLTSYTKINPKWFSDLNIKHDTIKLLEENTGKTFSDTNRSNIFLSLPRSKYKTKNKQMGPNQT